MGLSSLLWLPSQTAAAEPIELPIDRSAIQRTERSGAGIRNAFLLDQLEAATRSGEGGVEIDLRSIHRTLDGTPIDPSRIYGSVQAGPYPFEADGSRFAYKRFRIWARIEGGLGRLELDRLLRLRGNSEGWSDGGRVCLRWTLHLETEGRDRDLGVYDTFLSFRVDGIRTIKQTTLTEGPFVCMVVSDDPSRVRIALASDTAALPRIVLDDGRIFAAQTEALRHEIEVDGLQPSTTYRFRVEVGEEDSHPYRFRTAPPVGAGPIRFAYAGDTRAGMGGGMASFMGHNQATLERLCAIAYQGGAEFFLMGGDLVSGYTTSRADFRTQLTAWKQTVSGFWNERSIYPGIGNHDALMRVYDDLEIDRWPYATDSAEAVWAELFYNPKNGPAPSDHRRPPYEESAYSFRYGLVKVIAFNNNYWYADPSDVAGGCPEGYILEDQLDWIREEIRDGDEDTRIRYIVLFAQEPLFPSGGHVGDAMWYDGDNRIRAYSVPVGETQGIVGESKGLLEVRNELVRLFASSKKVAAILAGDEHAYARVLIDRNVPIGDPLRDDRNGDGKIDWPSEAASPLQDLRHPVWYLTSGGGGATYYSEEPTPWSQYWHERAGHDVTSSRYFYSSQENLLLFHADEERIGVDVVNPHGERIDQIDDLMEVKETQARWGSRQDRR